MEITINVNMDHRCRFCHQKGAEIESSICLGCVGVIIKSGVQPDVVIKAVKIVRKEGKVSVDQLQRTLGLDLTMIRRLLDCLQDLKVIKRASFGHWEVR